MSGARRSRPVRVDTFNESQDEFFVRPSTAAATRKRWSPPWPPPAGNPPHIVQVYEVGTRQMLDSGVIYPVYQLMADYGIDIDWDAFIGPVRGYYEFQGNLYSMPFNSSSPIMYYNKDAFRAAGLDPEKPPTTWQELEQVCRAILEAGVTRYCSPATGRPGLCWRTCTPGADQPFATHNPTALTAWAGAAHQQRVRYDASQQAGRVAQGRHLPVRRRGSGASPMFSNGDVAIFMESSRASRAATRPTSTGARPCCRTGASPMKVNTIIGDAVGHAGPRRCEPRHLEFFSSWPRRRTRSGGTKHGLCAHHRDGMERLEAEGYFNEHPEQKTALLQLTRGTGPTPRRAAGHLRAGAGSSKASWRTFSPAWSRQSGPEPNRPADQPGCVSTR